MVVNINNPFETTMYCIKYNTKVVNFNMNIWLIDYGIQPSATVDMIVTQGAIVSIMITYLLNKCKGHLD